MVKFRYIAILTLLSFCGAGFSILDNSGSDLREKYSASAASKRNSKKNKKESKKSEKKDDVEEKKEDTELLMDNELARDYMPDIYRCPDCGYEQDEPGYCPDHVSLELIKIISDPKDPLAPSELDGNEDILVDIPLNIQFKKDQIEEKKEDEESNNKKNSSNKSKKSK